MKMSISRRDFCAACGAVFAALHLPGCDLGSPAMPQPSPDLSSLPDLSVPPPHDLATRPDLALCDGGLLFGPAAALPLHDVRVMAKILLCRDEKGLYAMSGACTHAACPLEFRPALPEFYCGCHGSHFDYQGAVTKGPAPVALQHYAVCVNQDGEAVVDPKVVVDPTKRA